MPKIYLLLLISLGLIALSAQETRRLYIHELVVEQKNSSGKSWDTWGGAPDIKIAISVQQEGRWQKVYSSKVAKDTYKLTQFHPPVDLPVDAKVKLEIADADLRSDDPIANYEFTVVSEESEQEVQFDAVQSCRFLLSRYKSLEIKQREEERLAELERQEEERKREEERLRREEEQKSKERLEAYMRLASEIKKEQVAKIQEYHDELKLQQKKAPLELVVQQGHSWDVTCVAYSPDGTTIATGSKDSFVKIWNRNKKLLRSLSGHLSGVKTIAYSPDGKYLASGADHNRLKPGVTLKVWEVASGKLVHDFDEKDTVESLAFSPDGRFLATAVYRKVKIWSTRNGQLQRTLDIQGKSLGYSPDGKNLTMGGGVYNAGNGELIMELAKGSRTGAVYSPDGGSIAVWSRDLQIYDPTSGQLLQTIDIKNPAIADYLPDGRLLVRPNSGEAIECWQVRDKCEKLFAIPIEAGPIYSLSVAPDGSEFAVAGTYMSKRDGYAIPIYSVSEKSIVTTLAGKTEPFLNLNQSADGRLIAAQGEKSIAVWDNSNGRVIQTIHSDDKIWCSALSPKGDTLALGRHIRYKTEITFWNANSGELLHKVIVPLNTFPTALCYSPDGEFLAIGVHGGVAVLDIKNERIHKVIGEKEHTYPKKDKYDSGKTGIVTVDYSPDGTLLALGNQNAEVYVYQTDTGALLHKLLGHSRLVRRVRFSDDNAFLASAGFGDNTVKIWDVKTGRLLHTLESSGLLTCVDFSPDGKKIAAGDHDSYAKIWDVESGKLLHTLIGHRDSVLEVLFHNNGRYLSTTSRDQTVKLWKVDSGEEIISLAAIGNGDWAIVRKDGYFECSIGAKEEILFVQGIKAHPLDQFYHEFYRPGLLIETLSQNAPVEKTTLAERLAKSPPPEVTIAEINADSQHAKIKVSIIDNGGGIAKVQLFHNGKNVAEYIPQQSGDTTIELPVTLIPGDNLLYARAYTQEHIEVKSNETRINWQIEEDKIQYYLLVIGISQYPDASANLPAARRDASNFLSVVEKASNVHALTLYDAEATKPNITAKLQYMAKKARSQDIVIVYYAGRSATIGKEFYLAPNPISKTTDNHDAVREQGISTQELVHYFKNVKALKQVMLLNAWEESSGTTQSDKSSFGDIKSFLRWTTREKTLIMLGRASGAHVLTVVRQDKESTNAEEQGIFVEVLEKFMQGKDSPFLAEKAIRVYGLRNYLDKKIRQLRQEKKTSLQYHGKLSPAEDFAIVDQQK